MPRRTSLWRGHLKLSLVSCPVRMYPATTRANRVAFHRLSARTHNRIEMRPHDAETGREVERDQLVRGYAAEEGALVLVEDEDLAELRLESSRTIELDSFVAREEIDPLYFEAPYRLLPDGPVGEETYRVISAAMRRRRRAALGRVVLGSRERRVCVEARDDGMLLTTLRPAEEVRDPADYFAEIGDAPADEEMVALVEALIARKAGHFDPARLEDRYQAALRRLIAAKEKGERPVEPQPAESGNVIDLMAKLKRSLQHETGGKPPRSGNPRRKR